MIIIFNYQSKEKTVKSITKAFTVGLELGAGTGQSGLLTVLSKQQA